MNFVLVNSAQDLSGTQADGIVGLTPVSIDGADLLVDVLFNSKVINKREFLVYIGKRGTDKSYIDFGEYTEKDRSNATVLNLKPLEGDAQIEYWSVDHDGFFYGKNEQVTLTTKGTVWDTGTSLVGLPSSDLAHFILTVSNGKQIYSIDNSYAIK